MPGRRRFGTRRQTLSIRRSFRKRRSERGRNLCKYCYSRTNLSSSIEMISWRQDASVASGLHHVARGIHVADLVLGNNAAFAARQPEYISETLRVIGDDMRTDVAWEVKEPAFERLLARGEHDFQFMASGVVMKAQIVRETFTILGRNNDSRFHNLLRRKIHP